MGTQQGNDSQFLETVSVPPQWSLLFRSIFCGGLAGVLAGVVVLGIGSRLAMRVVALLNAEANGTLTDAEQVVGAITLGGTVELIVFGGLFGGLFAGVIWVVVRERLPDRLSLRIPLAGVIATLIGSFAIIESSNIDFRLFDPVVLNVAMFIMLVGLAGSATASGDWVLQRHLPSSAGAGVLYAALLGLGAFLALPLTISFFFFLAGNAVEDPPRLAGVFFCVAAVGALLSWTRHTPWRMSIPQKAGAWIGTFGLAGLLVFGGLHLVGEITKIL